MFETFSIAIKMCQTSKEVQLKKQKNGVLTF